MSSLSAAEALSAARAAEREMDKLRRQLQMTAKVSTKKASQRETAARRAIAEARAELEAAQREAADARERPSPAHVTVRDLTPAGCVAALATTMYPHGANGTGAIEWLQNNCPVDNMMIITNGLRGTGEALSRPEYFDE